MTRSIASLLPTLAVVGATLSAQAASEPGWPQWGGPHRNFIVESTGLADNAGVLAHGPDFSGLAGLIAAGAPETLHGTHPANGTLIIESQINEGHARISTPRAKSSTPVGRGGSITMTSRWDGPMLVGEGIRESPSGASTIVRQVREVIAEGRTLTIEVTTTPADDSEKSASTLTYARAQGLGLCQSWPTRCKAFR